MTKAEKARLHAEEVARTAPGLPSAFAAVGVIVGACLVVALAVYGVVSTIDFIDTRGSLIGVQEAPAYALAALALQSPQHRENVA